MSLLVLRYHRASAGPRGNAPEMLDAHFGLIAQSHRCLLPGESPEPGRLNVCLCFDDATFDFHAVVFPLLQKHELRALLAVTPGFIRERADVPVAARLRNSAENEHPQPSRGGFCTWPELREIANSGQVVFAAHGYTHCRLDRPGVDLYSEIVLPQSLLAGRLGQPVSSFVFPFGRFSPPALRQVRQIYRHAFRIGGAANRDWNGRLLYRIDADRLASPDAPFGRVPLAIYRLRGIWNRLRRR